MTTIVAVPTSTFVKPGVATAHCSATNAVADRFFGERVDAIARACQAMAERFEQGGRLFVAGDGAQRSDVAHVVVEFMHPVVVGKRALPAIALPDIGSGAAQHALGTLGRSGDMLLVLSGGAIGERAHELVAAASGHGLLTIALGGREPGAAPPPSYCFAVPSSDPCIVQETHEMLYHVVWELVHVFFEHRPVAS